MFPTRIQLSKKTWDRLQYLQTRTKLTPNITARLAITIALRDVKKATINENKPEQLHTINRDTLFGEHEAAYAALIKQFCAEQKITADINDVIRSLVDNGLHKIGHLKTFSDLKTIF